MPKKICFITPQIYPDFVGGAEVFNYYLIKHLAQDNQVSYITLSKNNIKEATRLRLKTNKSLLQQFEIIKRIIGSSKNEIYVISFMKTKWIYILAYPILHLLFGKQYIIIIHGGGMMPWKWKFPFKLFFKRAKAIFGVSKVICTEYQKRTNVVINYFPPLIPFETAVEDKSLLRKINNFNEEDKIFLIVGSLKKIKNPMIVIEALGALDKSFLIKEKVRVLFAGEGPLKEELEKLVYINGLQEFVSLLGNVPRDKINEYYKLSDYYIISSDFEGTPISMLEAMYNKLVIIGSDAVGINNIIKESDGGFLFDNSNPLELKKIMENVIINDQFDKRNNAYNFFNNNFKYTNLINDFLAKI